MTNSPSARKPIAREGGWEERFEKSSRIGLLLTVLSILENFELLQVGICDQRQLEFPSDDN